MATTPNFTFATGNSYRTGNADDGYYTIELPWNINFVGFTDNKIYVGTNSYITVGGGSAEYNNLTATNPAFRKLAIGATDNYLSDFIYSVQGTSPNRTAYIKYTGYQYGSSFALKPLVWEVTFFENANGLNGTNTDISVNIIQNWTTTAGYATLNGVFSASALLGNILTSPGAPFTLRIALDGSSAFVLPTKTLTIAGNNNTFGTGQGVMMIAKYGTPTAALGDPQSYVQDLYFHSGLPYIQITQKLPSTPNTGLVFPAVPRGTITWSDSGGGKGGVCFSPDTKITMFDGSKKLIKDVVVGDLVWNKTKTKANTVTFIEKANADDYLYLYSHTSSFKPFATVNHPLFIDGTYRSPMPEAYIWLDAEYLEPIAVTKSKDICDTVYNLWTTGDHTYIVNDVGTHSIVDDGGAMLHCYQQGVLTHSQCSDIIIDLSSDSPEHLYGAYLINKFIKNFNYKLINRLLVYFATSNRKTIQRQIFKVVSKLVGTAAKRLRKI